MKVLIYGSRGWIASYVIPELVKQGHEIVEGSRADDPAQVKADLDTHKPTHVLSLIGRTHGATCPTIDYLEEPGRLHENIRDNLFAPLVLALECQRRGVHFTYMGTGCIFSAPAETAFDEASLPNFIGSQYSTVKGFTDRLMHLEPLCSGVLNLRIRMPITADRSGRNFITKITQYAKICSMPNSMSVLPTLLPYLGQLMERRVTGTLNFTNPGYITHNEILEMYAHTVDPRFTWENFTEDEQNGILLSKRSNNHLDTSRLRELLPDVPDIYEAIKSILACMANKTYSHDA